MTYKVAITLLAVALLAGLLAASCGGKKKPGVTYTPVIEPANFTTSITNRYYPLVPGTTLFYEEAVDGELLQDEVTVTFDTKVIMGVTCVVVRDVVTSEDGAVVEDTLDWYAQDSEGNVWYFGEDTKEYEDGKVKSTAGSWEAGVDGAQPGIVMEASPQVGDEYRQEYYAGEAEDMARVLAVNLTRTVTAGSYTEVVQTEDFTPLDPDIVEHKYYAPGVGFIYSELVEGGSEQAQLVRIITQ
jgi:hypothetical protein